MSRVRIETLTPRLTLTLVEELDMLRSHNLVPSINSQRIEEHFVEMCLVLLVTRIQNIDFLYSNILPIRKRLKICNQWRANDI